MDSTRLSRLMQAAESSRIQAEKNFPGLALTQWEPPVSEEERLRRAERLRAALCSVPFYAKKAQRAKEEGDEMAYWLGLQASEATLRRP